MRRDPLEFSIAQYADGTLPAGERAALEAVLARDEAAQALLAEYRELNSAFAACKAMPTPDVRWDRFAAHLSQSVAALGETSAPSEMPGAEVRDVPVKVATDVSEELEFAIAQYADGTLPAAERAALEARLSDEPALTELLVAYRSIDDGLRTDALPAVRWDGLADQISRAVAQLAQAEDPVSEESEFAIAQYADGTLAADQVAAVEALLERSPAARLLLADYQTLEGAIASAARTDPLPAVQWDRLAGQLSRAVAEEDSEAEVVTERRPASYRIFSLLRSPMRLAAAASVLLAVGFGIRLMRPVGTPTTPVVIDRPAVAVVAGPSAETAPGQATVEVSIGPPTGVAGAPAEASGFTDDIASRPSRTIIYGGLAPKPSPAQDDPYASFY